MTLYTRELSAKSLVVAEMFSGMSFIYIRKSSGPRTVPCGTPDVTSAGLEYAPSRTISCCLSARKSEIQSFKYSIMLQFLQQALSNSREVQEYCIDLLPYVEAIG